ncbi:MAG: alkaline phosphatase D family protein, partial [Pseudomonas sp.]|nr:alkaline phosphatase D family protein [Pseudomonas sp.]
HTLLRVWIEVDNTQSGEAVAAMTLVCAGPQRRVQAWPLRQQALDAALGSKAAPAADAGISYALADIEVPNAWLGSLSIAMVSLHRYAASAAEPDDACQSNWPSDWGQPLSVSEALASGGRTPARGATPTSACPLPSASAEAEAEATVAQIKPLPSAPIDKRIEPLPLALNLADAQALLHPLAITLQQGRQLASRAQPATLSRQRRSLRWMRECVVRLRAEQWQPGPSFSFLAASCRHPGLTELEAQRSDASLAALALRQRHQPAALMLMLGDQIYADARAGLLDSSSSLERLLPRYREAFGSPAFAALARSTPLHMLMDDHELVDNWSRDLLLRGPAERELTTNALAAYQVFQRAHGPDALDADGHDACFSLGAAGFYSLNTRIQRQRAPQRRLLTDSQWQALEDWLLAEQARGR